MTKYLSLHLQNIISRYFLDVVRMRKRECLKKPVININLSISTLVLTVVLTFSYIGLFGQENRTIDGTGNNIDNPNWGAVEARLSRYTSISYEDGISSFAGQDRPNPRFISNELFAQELDITNDHDLSDYVWAFGQFIDHDISLTSSNPAEPAFIVVPEDDEYFSPGSFIFMFRSMFDETTGNSIDNPREHLNEITSFLDGSVVYGSSEERAQWLRTFSQGKLKVSEGNLLPWNTITGEFNSPTDPFTPEMADDTHMSPKLYVAGDVRANENPLLIALHTLFVREHNRLCDEIVNEFPSFSDEEIYQAAKRKVSAYIQSITFNEWLPVMGVNLAPYNGYQSTMNPNISNAFSAAAFRLGHTLINSEIIRIDNEGNELPSGSITLREAFFNPTVINLAGGIEAYLKGMATQAQQELDGKIVDDVRNFLFGNPNEGGLDLAAININRGRERGLPDYNTFRRDMGLPAVSSFDEISNNSEVSQKLEELYGSVENIDPWVGLIVESHMPGSMFGETIMAIMERQFQVLRDGDRFYFENDPAFSFEEIEEIKSTRMHDIIMRNTAIDLMQKDVFRAMPHSSIPNGPEIAKIDLEAAVYPNPTIGPATVKVYVEQDTEVNIRIVDYIGRTINENQVLLSEGENFIDLDMTFENARGFYNIMLETESALTILKLVKER